MDKRSIFHPTSLKRLGLTLCFMLSTHAWAAVELPGPDCAGTAASVAVEDGVIHYNRAGDGAPVILLHGLFAQKEHWNRVFCGLAAARFDTIALDLPGFGASRAFPVTTYDLTRQVELLHQFIGALEVQQIHLAGNSMGGTIAALFAQRFPALVRRLAFVGPPLGIEEWGPEVQRAIIGGVNPFVPIDRAQYELELSLLFDQPPEIPADLRDAFIDDSVSHLRHYQKVWNIVNLFDDIFDDCSGEPLEISAPVLILWGESDRIYPISGAESLHKRLPGSKLVTLRDVGHLPMLEQSKDTSAHLIRFFSDRH